MKSMKQTAHWMSVCSKRGKSLLNENKDGEAPRRMEEWMNEWMNEWIRHVICLHADKTRWSEGPYGLDPTISLKLAPKSNNSVSIAGRKAEVNSPLVNKV